MTSNVIQFPGGRPTLDERAGKCAHASILLSCILYGAEEVTYDVTCLECRVCAKGHTKRGCSDEMFFRVVKDALDMGPVGT